MKTAIIIPARMDSQRLPGKPLRTDGQGRTLLERTYQRAVESDLGSAVYVAASDTAIIRFCWERGLKVIETPQAETGTQRVALALQHLKDHNETFDVAINLQCDEPFISPDDLRRLAQHSYGGGGWSVYTFIAPLCADGYNNSSVVKVVVMGECRWFSRHYMPGAFQHVGVYALQPATMAKFLSSHKATTHEKLESLEQISWMSHGVHIYAVQLEQAPPAINTEHDLEMLRQGEFDRR